MSSTDYVSLTERYLERNRALGAHWYTLEGHRFEVFEGVFSPLVFEDTAFFARSVLNRRASGSLLEIGCGAGIVAALAALDGASPVVATDISPAAVRNTSANARRLGAEVDVREGDVFGPITVNELFDTIFWNPPFISRGGTSTDWLGRAVFDPDYQSLARYLEEGTKLLRPGGRLLFGFSTASGNLPQLEGLAVRWGLTFERRAATILQDEGHAGFSLELFEARA